MKLFQEPLYRRYHASCFSLGHFFVILCKICFILLPFFLAHNSSDENENGGIWLKQDTYREQPNVAYAYKVVLMLEATDISGNVKQIFFSTMTPINEAKPHTFRMSSIRSQELDYDLDNDNTCDQLRLNIMVPLLQDESVYNVQALVFFDYQLQKRAKIKMESLAYIHASFALPTLAFSTIGNLNFKQSSSLHVRKQISNLYENEPLLDATSPENYDYASTIVPSQDMTFSKILEAYSTRAYKTDYEELYPYWKSRKSDNDFDRPFNDGKIFNFTAVIHYPVQEVRYIPTISEVLKDAWIKYLSLAVIVGYCLKSISSFVFFHQM